MTTRRDFLKSLGVAAPAIILPRTGLTGMGGGGRMGGGGAGGGLDVPVFEQPLYIPPVLQPVESTATRDTYALTQENATVEIVPGTQTAILGYNGMTPGPTMVVDADREVAMRHTNNSNVRTATHLHGGHMRAGDDGHPVAYVNPGETREYVYSNEQLPATLWYHDHTMDLTGDQEIAITTSCGRFSTSTPARRRPMTPAGRIASRCRRWRPCGSSAASTTMWAIPTTLPPPT